LNYTKKSGIFLVLLVNKAPKYYFCLFKKFNQIETESRREIETNSERERESER